MHGHLSCVNGIRDVSIFIYRTTTILIYVLWFAVKVDLLSFSFFMVVANWYENRIWHFDRIDIKSIISRPIFIKFIKMLSIIIFLLVSVANTQYYYPQQQYLLNNYNSGSSYSQNYPTWNPAIQQSK